MSLTLGYSSTKILTIFFKQISSVPYENAYNCLTVCSLQVMNYGLSMGSLVMLSLDRFWAINYPISYFGRDSRTMTLILALSWIPHVVVGLLPLLGWNRIEKHESLCKMTEVFDSKMIYLCNFQIVLHWFILIIVNSLTFVAIKKQVSDFLTFQDIWN